MPSDPLVQERSPYHCIGKYAIVSRIATGGMGVVYRAVDQEQGHDVALKVLSPALANKDINLERFRREARSNLRHGNLVAMYEFGQANDVYYLAMEFVDGIDLFDHIEQHGPMDADGARSFLTQAASVLDYLHQHKIVHRDIKPANFLVTFTEGRLHVKLTDLGLAREINPEHFRVTQDGNTVGTIDYMAPEQARDSGLADIRSDIYSLGCTCYHVLAGDPPFAEGGLSERLYAHMQLAPPDIRKVNANVSASFARILSRMMAKKPEDRYQTPRDLLDDLARPEGAAVVATSAPTAARPVAANPWSESRSIEPTETAVGIGHHATSAPRDRSPRSISDNQRQSAAELAEQARGQAAAGKLDEAIGMLRTCCRLDPANLAYRQTLRQLEKKKQPMPDQAGALSWLTGLPARAKLKAAQQAADYLKVLEHGEEMLARNPWDLTTQMEMAEAAASAGLATTALWLLEDAWREDRHTPALDRALARQYEKRGLFADAARLWRMVLDADPYDVEAHRKVGDLAVEDTIARGGYGSRYRDINK
jgi:serine/threonine protein kinase